MAFLIEEGRRKFADFPRELEEEGIKFNVENATEDLISGLFCAYEPPTSKKMQYNAAKAVRENPKKFTYRPHIPKSILKWKIKKMNKKKNKTSDKAPEIPGAPASEAQNDANNGIVVYDKKSVTWRDERSKRNRTEIENKVVGIAAKYCGGACNQGEDIADILSSPTGRATQNFFMGGAETPGSMASMASSILKKKSEPEESNKRVLYDDLGNPIREDDVNEDDNASFFPSTPKSLTAGDEPTTPPDAKSSKYNGHSNLFCSNIPFIDTVKEGIEIAGIAAASAAVAAGVPENLCYTTKPKASNANEENQLVTVVSDQERDEISEELRKAQQSPGFYEPESYDQPSGGSKLKRQSTPKHVRPDRKFDNEGEDEDGESKKEDDESQKQAETKATEEQMSSERSYAHSDITMGNTTIKHFSGNVSLFDDTIDEPTKRRESVQEDEPTKRRESFSSMVEELKSVQIEKQLEGSSQHNVESLKKGFEKISKSPKHSVVTNSYKQSLKRSPATPLSQGKVADIFQQRNGSVANLAKQFESPRATRPMHRGVRKSIDPTECRTNNPSEFNGVLLPPTPRRRSPETPTGYSMVNKKLEVLDWDKKRRNNNNNKEETAPATVSVNTDAEIREEASTILDAGPRDTGNRRRPKSLVTGPETVEDDASDPPEEREETETRNDEDQKETNKKKTKNDKKKMSRMKSFKKSVGKALGPGLNVIKKVESQRILNKIG